MNLLFICDEFPPGKTGGIGSAIEVLAKSLQSRGHNVFIAGLCVHGYGALDFEEREDGIKVWRLRYATDIGLIKDKDSLFNKLLVHSLRQLGVLRIDARIQFKKLIGLVGKIVFDYKIDLIEIPDWNNFFFNLHPSDFVIPNFGIPLHVKMHGSFNYFRSLSNQKEKKTFRRLENSLYSRADYISAVSSFTANYCKKLYKIEKEIQVLFNGVILESYCGPEKRSNKARVIFTGSLLEKKGIYSLAKAWQQVVKVIPEAKLNIYGKGNQSKVRAFLNQGFEQSVFFYGHVQREKLMHELRLADVAVFPSFSETFGMAAAEAMGTGCPVIFTNRTSGPEIITDGKEGWLIDPAKPEEIANAIIEALNSIELRTRYSKAGYDKVKRNFEISIVAEAHEKFYNRICVEFKLRNYKT